MKASFGYIIRVIIIALVLILIVQIFWLARLYSTIEGELSKDIQNCIEISDRAEIVLRMKSMSRSANEQTISIQKTINYDDDIPKDSVSISEQIDVNFLDSDSDFLSFILKDIGVAMHQSMDSMRPINLERLDSLISASFKNRDIHAQLYYTDIIDLENNNNITQTSRKTSDNIRRKGVSFIYEFRPDSRLAYHVHVKPLRSAILLQMSGILTTTLLIIVILSFAFWYLITTIMRQKTLEEIKDDFINNVTHEFKTPIAVAYSAVDALLNFKQADDPQKSKKYLTICKEQLSGLGSLVEQILSMSMERNNEFVLNKEQINIANMLNNLILQHRLKHKKQLVFDLRIAPEDLMIYSDYTHLNNVISNLIDNAIKYSEEQASIFINIFQEEQYDIIQIKDNGIGIPEDKIPYIFDKFFRITEGDKYTVKGYGLGLFYVKTIIEQHDGHVTVESCVGLGTTLSIKIPTKR